MTFHLRPSQAEDIDYLLDIDMKSFEFPWGPDDWRRASKNAHGSVVTWYGTPVGFAIFRRNGDGDVEIDKIAVKAPYRNRGLGRTLIRNCVLYSHEIHAPRLVLMIPERRICPGSPEDLSTWLKNMTFKAETPFWKDYFTFYGEPEDGVLFSLPVPFE